MEMIRFKKEHLKELAPRCANPFMGIDYGEILEKQEHSYTGVINERVIFCGGAYVHRHGRAELWALLDNSLGRDFIKVHNAVKRMIENCKFERLEAVVRCDFLAAHRWARVLGFSCEASCMRSYAPGGIDMALYGMVRE